MIVTLYIDLPTDESLAVPVLDWAAAYARPAVATADGWTRWRIDLDLVGDQSACEATVRKAKSEECAAFEPKRIG